MTNVKFVYLSYFVTFEDARKGRFFLSLQKNGFDFCYCFARFEFRSLLIRVTAKTPPALRRGLGLGSVTTTSGPMLKSCLTGQTLPLVAS